MNTKKIDLWNKEEMVERSGSGSGSFNSCTPSMTFYPPASGKSDGCVIVIPGGGYEMKSADNEGSEVAKMLSENNIASYVLDYRVAPDRHPSPLNDASRSIAKARELSEKFGYSKDKISVMGFSAGGHLAACASTMWNSPETKPDAQILCYPVISMEKNMNINSKTNLFGEKINDSSASDMSCQNRVDRQTPPAFIWHTSDDKSVTVQNTLLYANALSAKNIPFEIHIYPEGEHGLGLAKNIPGLSGWPALCVDWLKRMGY